MSREINILFGKIALEKGFISLEQFQEVLALLEKIPGSDVKTLLLNKGFLSERQAHHLHRLLLTQSQGGEGQLGDYRLLNKLGQGGMGSVYKALHLPTKQIRAVKILSRELAQDFEYIQRFIREARITAGLMHPHIVQTYEAKREGDYYYIAMEYIQGQSLDQYIEEKGHLEEKEALELCLQVAEALGEAKKQEVVHRDIKPENILLTEDKTAKLTDFGLVKVQDNVELTQTGYVVGTPTYVSPEQAMGEKEIDIRSDIYSLGITLFQMVTGQVPFDHDNAAMVFKMQVKEPLPNPKKINPQVSKPLVRLLKSMTAKKPRQRPQSPQALIKRIHLVLKGEDGLSTGLHTTRIKTRMAMNQVSLEEPKKLPKKLYIFLPFFLGLGLVLVFLFFYNPAEKPTENPSLPPKVERPRLQTKYAQVKFLKETVRDYFQGDWPLVRESLDKLPGNSKLEVRQFSLGLGALLKAGKLFGTSDGCLVIKNENTFLSLYKHLRSLETILKKWKNYPGFPRQWNDLKGEITGAILLLKSESLRMQGQVAGAVKKIALYEKTPQSSLFRKKTFSATALRKKVYALYAQEAVFFDLTTDYPVGQRMKRLSQYLTSLWKLLLELSQNRKLSYQEEVSILRDRDWVLRHGKEFVQQYQRKKVAHPELCKILWLMISNENLLAPLSRLAPNELRATSGWLSTITMHPPLGLDRLQTNRWMLLSSNWSRYLLGGALQLFQNSPNDQRAWFNGYISTLLLNMTTYRSLKGDQAFFNHIFTVLSAEWWLKQLTSFENMIRQYPPTPRVSSVAFKLPGNSFFYLLKRGDLIQKNTPYEFMGSKDRFPQPIIQLLPGKIRKYSLFFQLKPSGKLVFILNNTLAVLIGRKGDKIGGSLWQGRGLSLQNLTKKKPSKIFSVQREMSGYLFFTLKGIGREGRLYFGNWNPNIRLGRGKLSAEIPKVVEKRILWAQFPMSPSSQSYNTLQIFLGQVRLRMVNLSMEYTAQDLIRCIQKGKMQIRRYVK